MFPFPNPVADGQRKFCPIRHVALKATELQLSPRARHLALELAVFCRLMQDGSYQLWRGRESIAKITGLSVKTITKVRRELLQKGLFIERHPVEHIAANGRRFKASPRVPTLELVRNPTKLVLARESGLHAASEARNQARATNLRRKRTAYLALQKQKVLNQISEDEYARQVRALETEPIGEAPSP